MKKVYKYGTGDTIPEHSQYLCTKTEVLTDKQGNATFTKNVLVWHYFLVEVVDEQSN